MNTSKPMLFKTPSAGLRYIVFLSTVGLIVLATLVGGWSHARMAAPSGKSKALLVVAGKRLDIPLNEQIGSWRLVAEAPFPKDTIDMLQCPSHISRSYMHQQTGDVISVMVIVGPPGPIAAHTPEVCYSSQDFTMQNERSRKLITDRGNQEHTLWRVTMEPRNSFAPTQSVVYGWTTGKTFDAPTQPRVAFSNKPYLYKIQVAGPVKASDEAFQPTEDFLSWFMPEIQSHLIPIDVSAAADGPASQ